MSRRYDHLVEGLRQAVLAGPAVTATGLRRAVEARAAAVGGRAGLPVPLPAELEGFVVQIARRAAAVTEDDVNALKRAGWSEDEIFEVIASAALGAGLARLERGLAALEGRV
jgi:alkylhydroperoxidase family enzyme